jgi:hypothetical protein
MGFRIRVFRYGDKLVAINNRTLANYSLAGIVDAPVDLVAPEPDEMAVLLERLREASCIPGDTLPSLRSRYAFARRLHGEIRGQLNSSVQGRFWMTRFEVVEPERTHAVGLPEITFDLGERDLEGFHQIPAGRVGDWVWQRVTMIYQNQDYFPTDHHRSFVRLHFLGVVLFRFRQWGFWDPEADGSFRPDRRTDRDAGDAPRFGFVLRRTSQSRLKERTLSQAGLLFINLEDSPSRLGPVPESAIHHYQLAFDELGKFDVLCTDLEISEFERLADRGETG